MLQVVGSTYVTNRDGSQVRRSARRANMAEAFLTLHDKEMHDADMRSAVDSEETQSASSPGKLSDSLLDMDGDHNMDNNNKQIKDTNKGASGSDIKQTGFALPTLDEGRVQVFANSFPTMATEWLMLSSIEHPTWEQYRYFCNMDLKGYQLFLRLVQARRVNGDLPVEGDTGAMQTEEGAETSSTRKTSEASSVATGEKRSRPLEAPLADFAKLSEVNTQKVVRAVNSKGEPIDLSSAIKLCVQTELNKIGMGSISRDIPFTDGKRDSKSVMALANLASRGLANHVKKADVEAILANEYVSLEHLMPMSFSEAAKFKDKLTWDLDESGRLVASHVRPSKKITCYEQWSMAFNVFKSVYLVGFPDQHLALLKYEEIIRSAATTHRWDGSNGWLDYDVAWRKNKELQPDTPWGVIDQDMWCLHVMRPPKAALLLNATSGGGGRIPTVGGMGTKAGSRKKFGRKPTRVGFANGPVCDFYNKVTGCKASNCRFQHACSLCKRLNHPIFHCFSRSQTQRKGSDVSTPSGVPNK